MARLDPNADRQYEYARRKAELGRVCVACAINDSETLWSGVERFCTTCDRTQHRNGVCNRCSLPLRGHPILNGACKKVLLCGGCDSKIIAGMGRSRTILVSPTDDRERVIWRVALSPNHKNPLRAYEIGPFPDVMVATPEQWKTWR